MTNWLCCLRGRVFCPELICCEVNPVGDTQELPKSFGAPILLGVEACEKRNGKLNNSKLKFKKSIFFWKKRKFKKKLFYFIDKYVTDQRVTYQEQRIGNLFLCVKTLCDNARARMLSGLEEK